VRLLWAKLKQLQIEGFSLISIGFAPLPGKIIQLARAI